MGWLLIIVGAVLVIVYAFSFIKDKRSVSERIASLPKDKYSTDMGRFAARKEARAAEARVGTLKALNDESNHLIASSQKETLLDTVEFDQAHNIPKLERAEEREISEHHLTLKLMDQASKGNIDVPTYLNQSL